VKYPSNDLLDLLALEAYRAGAFVVGEDLGTVSDDIRIELASRKVLSYRLLWFEEGPPAELPRNALSAVTTHDLPTIAGVWTGQDQRNRVALGFSTDDETEPFQPRLHELTKLPPDAPVEDVVVATYRALAEAPSLVLLATLEDAVATPDRPNFPGTIDEWPNWRIPLPATLEQLTEEPLPRLVAEALNDGVNG
jgi:4-alpha-glucanotransferase